MNYLPRVTMFMFCYKQERFIKESVTSLLQQDYPNLKVVISDDASPDSTYSLIEALVSSYKGKIDVVINKNKKNLGIGRHFAYVMDSFIEGELAVACGGDDVSASNRVSRIVQEWLGNGKPALVAHSLEEIDVESNVFIGGRTIQYKHQDHSIQSNQLLALQDYLRNQIPVRYLGAAIAYRTDAYVKFGTPKAYPDYEDHLMYFRALLTNGIHYFTDILVQYRRHDESFMADPIKRKVVIPAEMFTVFLDSKGCVRSDYINAYRLHQLTTQQWLDYSNAVINNIFSIDYQVVDDIWTRLLSRHKHLLKNRGNLMNLTLIFRGLLSWIKPNRDQAKVYKMDYVKPLKTILYGAGGGGKNALSRIGSGFEVRAICDSNPSLHGQKIEGMLVISPQQLKSVLSEIDCILITSVYFYEIKSFLVEELSIPEKMIVRLPHTVITG